MRSAIAITAGVLVTGLALTIAAAYWVKQRIYEEANSRFVTQVDLVASDIQRRFNQPVYGLKGARGLYAASKFVSRSAFRAYVTSRNLPLEFPGVRGFGFVQKVMREDLDRFVAEERRDEAPDFTVRTSGAAPDLYVVKFIEPLAAGLAAWGLDWGADAVRREAIEHAISSGEATLSRPVVLAQDAKQGPGFLYMLPVYRHGTEPDNFRQREEALLGLLYSPIVVSEILEGIVNLSTDQMDFELSAVNALDDNKLLYSSLGSLHPTTQGMAHDANYADSKFATFRHMLIGDRLLKLGARSTPNFERFELNSSTPELVGFGGGLLSLMLAAVIWLQTTRRERAEKLAQSMTADMDRLAKVVQSTSNIVLITDADMNITWVNDGFTRSYGYTLEEATGRKPSDLLGSGKGDSAGLQMQQQAIAAGEGCRVEILNRAKNGKELWIDLDVQPNFDAQGKLTGFMEIGLDVTNRKLVREQLRTSNAFLDRAEEIAGVGSWEVDLRSQALTWSAQMYRIYDLEQGQQPTSAESLDFFGPEERKLIENAARECIKERKPWDLQLPLVTTKGRSIWVRSVGTVEVESDKPVRLVGALQDVTIQRTRDAELRRSNAVMQSIVDHLPCGLSVFDGDLRLVMHNLQFRRLLDLPDELFSRPVTTFESIIRYNATRGEYGEGDVDDLVAKIVERARHPIEHQFDRIRHDGLPLEIRGGPMPGGGLVTTYMDISERKKVDRLKDEFISTVSHELRTPLTSIFGSLRLLASGVVGDLPPDVMTLIKIASQNSERLIRLINDVLDLEKIESRSMTYKMTLQPLAPLIEQAIDATRAYVSEFGVSLEFDAKQDNILVEADSDRIVQVIINLISNAAKFSHREGMVLVRMSAEGRFVRVSVVDQGQGMSEDFRERIFQRFSQADGSDRRQKGGSGLGLNICKSIVEAHKGRIDYTSTLGVGSTFFFDLPMASNPSSFKNEQGG